MIEQTYQTGTSGNVGWYCNNCHRWVAPSENHQCWGFTPDTYKFTPIIEPALLERIASALERLIELLEKKG